MSGLPYTGGMNSYMFDISQYGVDMPQQDNTGEMLQGVSGLASLVPYIGPVLAAGMNFAGQYMQNQQQEYFYNKYMSPAARMAQMRAAGINPNAAAQGISGSSAPQMNAAAPTGAFNDIGAQLGNSVNTALTADAIKAGINKTNAETEFTNSLNVEKQTTNRYLDAMQQATLNKLVQDGRISKSFANMAAVDEAYKPANAYASSQQLFMNLQRTANEISNLVARTEHEYAAAYQAMVNAALSEAQIKKVFSDIGLNNAMIERISHEVGEIDARTAATYQGIDESKARTAAQEIQNKFQQDYYDIWQNTGFNWNSDIEKSVVGAYSNLDIKAGDRLTNSLGLYIRGVGDARSRGKDFMWDKIVDVYGDLARSMTGLGVASMVSGSRGSSSSPVVDKTPWYMKDGYQPNNPYSHIPGD